MEGPEEKGGAVSLRCKDSVGSTPLSYTWKRETGGNIPPDATLSEKKTQKHTPVIVFIMSFASLKKMFNSLNQVATMVTLLIATVVFP